MKDLIEKTLMLQLFGEGGGDGGAAGAAGDGAGTQTGAEGNEAQEVAVDAGAAPEDRRAKFMAMVKKGGEYEDIYREEVKAASMRRVKGMQSTVEKHQQLQPALEYLARRYDTTADDPRLAELIAADEGLLENRAMRNNRTTEEESVLVRAEMAEKRANDLVANILAKQEVENWQAQAQQLQKDYPAFDLDTEMQNPQFVALLRDPNLNLTLESAFYAIHGNDVVKYKVKQAEERITASVAANRSRPKENGAGTQATSGMHRSAMGMSKDEFRDICARVERGERVTLT